MRKILKCSICNFEFNSSFSDDVPETDMLIFEHTQQFKHKLYTVQILN